MKNKYRRTAECIRGDSEHYPERSDKMAIGLHKTTHIQHWALGTLLLFAGLILDRLSPNTWHK